MAFEHLNINGVFSFTPTVFTDSRGYFFESYNENVFAESSNAIRFVQDNQAFSSYGVLRGLHYQVGEFAQAKLVRALSGEILDVIVDLRRNSATFGKTLSVLLSAENKKQLYVPRGFAHGYIVLSKTAEILYKCDNFYHKSSERGIIFNDKTLAIDWQVPESSFIISEKDLALGNFDPAQTEFE